MDRLPNLTAVRAFEAVGRHGVATAASQLNVTPAAIYHQIRALESELGIALFTRSKRKGLVLTRKGEEYLMEVVAIFDALRESSSRVMGDPRPDRLVIDSLTTFATDFLAPRLPSFIAANPDIELEILTPTRAFGRINFEQTGASVAIRGGGSAGHWPDLHAEMLVHETFFPVCAPELLRGPKPLEKPSDLAKHTLLTVTRTPEGWPEWLAAAAAAGEDVSGVNLDQAIRFDMINMSMTAAIQGVGVDLARAPLVDHWMDAGKLVAPFDLKVTSTLSYWLICPEPFAETVQFQAFRSWIFDQLKASKYIQEEICPPEF